MKLIILLLLSSCTCVDSCKLPKKLPNSSTSTLLASKQGEQIFKANCAMCHGATGSGRIGPDIRYSSLELLSLKVTEGRYPEGYTPQRNTNNMPKFPHLHSKLPDIYEYLKSKR